MPRPRRSGVVRAQHPSGRVQTEALMLVTTRPNSAERPLAHLESERGATHRGFKSLRFRSCDQQKRRVSPSRPPGVSRSVSLSVSVVPLHRRWHGRFSVVSSSVWRWSVPRRSPIGSHHVHRGPRRHPSVGRARSRWCASRRAAWRPGHRRLSVAFHSVWFVPVICAPNLTRKYRPFIVPKVRSRFDLELPPFGQYFHEWQR
jgi:hypothetical protein